MSLPDIVSREEWLVARKQLLAEEKEMTRAHDRLAAKRRMLPMVLIEKEYVFQGPDGPVTLLDMFDGRRQLILRHFMFGPDWEKGCPGCTAGADEMSDGLLRHLNVRETSFVAVARAPIEKLEAYKAERGWTFPFYSSYGSDFNYDFHVTLDESVAPMEYNYRTKDEHEAAGTPGYVSGTQPIEQPGESYFLRDGDAGVPHVLDVRPRIRGGRRLVLLPRYDRARPAGGVGGAEGARRASVRRVAGVRHLSR